MANNNGYDDHPLDSLLDEESQEEFGLPSIHEKSARGPEEDVNGNLKNWSAEDFASMYVRFHPHLIRHAKRYLTNPVQAEEVVQDAFLYLMTTLPELDSELGVLKFLKWKVKMLSYDILRSSTMRRERPLPDSYEASEVLDSTTAAIERAEDNAVISLALASLNPRQREAIVASVYEEKSAEEVGYQLGLSSNAARQLIHRAKASFRKALIGEAEVRGKSVSEILSVAAKKAASDAQRHASKVGVVAGLLILGFGSLSSIWDGSTTGTEMAAPSKINDLGLDVPLDESPQETIVVDGSETVDDVPGFTVANKPLEASLKSTSSRFENDFEASEVNKEVVVSVDESELVIQRPAPSKEAFVDIMTTNTEQAGFYTDSYSALFSESFTGRSIEVFGGTGISAFLDLDMTTLEIREIVFQMWIEGERYMAIAKTNDQEIETQANTSALVVKSKDFYVTDNRMNVFSDSPLALATTEVEIVLDEEGHPLSARMAVYDESSSVS